MRALLYETEQEGKRQIVDYGIRLEQLPHYRPILKKVLDYVFEQSDATRAEVINQFLASCNPKEKVEGRYFDITLSEARFAYDALAISKQDKDLAMVLKGRIDAEYAFMMGLHEHSDSTISAVYTDGIGYERIPATVDNYDPENVAA